MSNFTMRISDQHSATIERLQEVLGGLSKKHVPTTSLTLLDWCVSQIEQGRQISSLDRIGENIREFVMVELDNVPVTTTDG